MIERQWAMDFAHEWIAAWNAHDLERILSHYSENFEMSSPLIIERMGEPSGVLKGKAAMRPYWSQAVALEPPLRFELLEVLVGVRSITIYYRSIGRRIGAEVLEFNASREVIRAAAHHALSE